MTNKIKIFIAIIAILIVAGLGYAYSRINNQDTTVEIGDGTNTKLGVTGKGNFTVEEVPLSPAIKAPSLDRPITYPSDMDEATRTNMGEKINVLISALKKDPNNLENWLRLAVDRKIIADYKGAVEIWEYVALLAPKDPIAFGNLGEVYEYYLKDYPKAEKNWLVAIKLKPNYIYGYRALYELYSLLYKDKSALAPKILVEGLEKNPNSIELMIVLAEYWKKSGDRDKALSYYNKALTEAKAQGNTALASSLQAEIDSYNQ